MSPDASNRAVTIETRADLDEILASSERVLVMVRTAGCAICKSMDPVIDNVARATDVAVVDFNPKGDLEAVDAFGVRSVPTFLLFEDGDLVDRLADGFVPTEDLVAFVEG